MLELFLITIAVIWFVTALGTFYWLLVTSPQTDLGIFGCIFGGLVSPIFYFVILVINPIYEYYEKISEENQKRRWAKRLDKHGRIKK